MKKRTEAKCNGLMLTAGFHAANPPLIWRFDLERNHSFTLALQGEEGDWELGVTSPKGEFYPVVHFLAREDAEEAFATIEKTLARKQSTFSYLLKSFLIVCGVAGIIVTGIVLYFGKLPPKNPSMSQTSTRIMPMRPTEGMPQPADDVLHPPPQ